MASGWLNQEWPFSYLLSPQDWCWTWSGLPELSLHSHSACVARFTDITPWLQQMPCRDCDVTRCRQVWLVRCCRSDGVGTVTQEEKEKFAEIKERLRVQLEYQLTNFRYSRTVFSTLYCTVPGSSGSVFPSVDLKAPWNPPWHCWSGWDLSFNVKANTHLL